MNTIKILFILSVLFGGIIIIVDPKNIMFGLGMIILPTLSYTFYILSKTPPTVGKEL